MPYIGAFAGRSTTAAAWAPGHVEWQVEGYQAVITQIPIGMGSNWIEKFARNLWRVSQKKPKMPASTYHTRQFHPPPANTRVEDLGC